MTSGRVSQEVADGLRADLGSSDRRVRDRAISTVDDLTPAQARREIGRGVYVSSAIVDDTMARSMFNSLVGFREQRGSLEALADIANRYGASAAIDREAAGELAAPMSRLMAMVANLEGSGIIGPGDLPRIQAALPNPQNLVGMTFGQLDGSLRGFRREIEASVRARLEFAGADQESINNALRYIREGLGNVGGGARAGSGSGSGSPRRYRITRTSTGESTVRDAATADQFRGVSGFTVEEIR
ncbi:hypothetical protein [Sandaracinus amylolyticus]|uniref:hypothetical protein n=1 Tax=Sandaracinus amylolyticus TaxID=927083 RepID=UPI001F3CF2CF|nr:hypothetical protein [Sandaracinus amylolyticus]